MSPDDRTGIVRRYDVDRGSLRRDQRVTEGNTAIVYVDRRGRMFVAEHALTAAEIWIDNPRVMFEVDMGIHHDTFALDLPSSEEAFSFHADISVSWQVQDAKKAVEEPPDDPRAVYRPLIRQELRRISRRFDVENSARAEDAIRTELVCERLRLPHAMALLTCSVALSLDSGTQQHIAERILTERAKENREREHNTKLDEAAYTALEENAAHQVAKIRAEQEQGLEKMREEHRIALQVMRMEFYDQALQDEKYGLIKLRLEKAPDDIDGVVELVARHRQLPWEEARAFLATAIDGGLVGQKHVAGLVYQAAETLTEGMRTGALRPENRREIPRPATPADQSRERGHDSEGKDGAGAGSQPEVRVERIKPEDGEKGDVDEYPV